MLQEKTTSIDDILHETLVLPQLLTATNMGLL
jgi:hypothetical protein